MPQIIFLKEMALCVFTICLAQALEKHTFAQPDTVLLLEHKKEGGIESKRGAWPS